MFKAILAGLLLAAPGALAQSATAVQSTAETLPVPSSTTDAPVAPTSSPAAPVSPVAPVAPTGPRRLARLEPADGKIILGAWLDTEDRPGARDTFLGFNQRIGFNAGSFQLSQQMPLADNPFIPGDKLYANMTLFNEGTNASLFLTIYPYSGLERIRETDIDFLVQQCQNITRDNGRNVYIRFGPEMNGAWMQGFGQRATEYKDAFRRIALRIHAETTAAMVWAPNLDQNGDSFSEYYPGDDVVDWVGLSVYWKGSRGRYPWIVSEPAPADFVAEIIDGLGGEGSSYSFYQNYAVARGKPMMITEGGGAYHIDCAPPGVSTFTPCRTETDRSTPAMSFYNSFLFRSDFRQRYPLLKMVQLFEFEKEESDAGYRVMRDFRVTTNNATLAQFRAGLQRFASGFEWAVPVTSALPTTSTARTTTTTSTTTTTTTTTTTATSVTTTATVAPLTTTTRSGAAAQAGFSVVAAVFVSMAAFAMVFTA
ncbi:hypothetical protein HDU96_005643 [Phlyctochytrium bullatum]|nr:hypothetical protein HDU96_005643 [Phlyctochytrium bullatum]